MSVGYGGNRIGLHHGYDGFERFCTTDTMDWVLHPVIVSVSDTSLGFKPLPVDELGGKPPNSSTATA